MRDAEPLARFSHALILAFLLNTTVVLMEFYASLYSGSLSLGFDALHNVSDEVALLLLVIAALRQIPMASRQVRIANLLNSVGILILSVLFGVEAYQRLTVPSPVMGFVPVVIGLSAAMLNAAVALVLRKAAGQNSAIHLAYAHNVGDALVSLAPVLSGILVMLTNSPRFDPVIALVMAVLICGTSLRAVWDGRYA